MWSWNLYLKFRHHFPSTESNCHSLVKQPQIAIRFVPLCSTFRFILIIIFLILLKTEHGLISIRGYIFILLAQVLQWQHARKIATLCHDRLKCFVYILRDFHTSLQYIYSMYALSMANVSGLHVCLTSSKLFYLVCHSFVSKRVQVKLR